MGLLRVTRNVAEDWENQASTIRRRLTEKAFSNTIEFWTEACAGEGTSRVHSLSEEFLARQAQTLADGTKEFSEQIQQATDNFASNATNAMEEGSRRADQTVSNLSSRAEHLSRRQQQRAEV